MNYIMHHGGAGTSGTAVTAGVPNSAIPFSVDQTFWAKRLVQLGVGPSAPPAKKITGLAVERIIIEGTENKEYLRQSRIISEKIKLEDGISTTIELIKKQFAKK
jgi:UDP:flavonoid glycosyltransferase YjiC (YdhE family)